MALFKVLRGNEYDLFRNEQDGVTPHVPLKDGNAYFTQDTHNFYIDHQDENGNLIRSLNGVGQNTIDGDIKFGLNDCMTLSKKGELTVSGNVISPNTKVMERQIDEIIDTTANSLVKQVTGEIVRIDDTSPLQQWAPVFLTTEDTSINLIDVGIKRYGKNLFDPSLLIEKGWSVANNIYSGNLSTINKIDLVNPICFKPNVQYTFSFTAHSISYDTAVCNLTYEYSDGTTSALYIEKENNVFTSEKNKTVTRLYIYSGTAQAKIENIQLEVGNKQTNYIPYINYATHKRDTPDEYYTTKVFTNANNFTDPNGYSARNDLAFATIPFEKAGEYKLRFSKLGGGFAYVSEAYYKSLNDAQIKIRIPIQSYIEAYAPNNSADQSKLPIDGAAKDPRNTLIRQGDWAEYIIQIPSPGEYEFGLKMGGKLNETQTFRVAIDETCLGANILYPCTTLFTDTPNVSLICYYNVDSNSFNLKNGNALGSLRSSLAQEENDNYQLGIGAVALGEKTWVEGEAAYAEGNETYILNEKMLSNQEISYISYNNSTNILTLSTENDFFDTADLWGFRIENMNAKIRTDMLKILDSVKNEDNSWSFEIETPSEILQLNIPNEISIKAILNDENYTGEYAHVEGWENLVIGRASHGEGWNTKALDNYAHAEGAHTTAGYTAHAEGGSTNALGKNSHSEGFFTNATAREAHAEGYYTTASGEQSHAEGANTLASGGTSHAEGSNTQATGKFSHAEGDGSIASAYYAHAEGLITTATNSAAHSEGYETKASGVASHAEGYLTKTGQFDENGNYISNTGNYAHAEGNNTTASGKFSHSEGLNTIASQDASHAEGSNTQATGISSHAEGHFTYATNSYAHAEGEQTKASGITSHAEGIKSEATNYYAHAEGWESLASGTAAHAEGKSTKATNSYAHAEGISTSASGYASHAEGSATRTGEYNEKGEYIANTGYYAHAEGVNTTASGNASHAEGTNTTASGKFSHAEGDNTKASAYYAHAEGVLSQATNTASHAEGSSTIASGSCAHAEGTGTIANVTNQHVQGKYNQYLDEAGNALSYAHVVGNGVSDSARSNAHTLDWNGNAWFAGDVSVGVKDEITNQTVPYKLAKESINVQLPFIDILDHGWLYTNSGLPYTDYLEELYPSEYYNVNISLHIASFNEDDIENIMKAYQSFKLMGSSETNRLYSLNKNIINSVSGNVILNLQICPK